MYYVSILPDGDTSVYSRDEAHLREYLRVFMDVKKPVIYSVNDVGLDKILRKKPGEEISHTFNDAPWMTDSDMEFMTENMQTDCEAIYLELKLIRRKLKMFKGQAAQDLRKAITEFFKERVPNEEVGIDEFDVRDRLFEKIKYTKYIKKTLPKAYCDAK